MILNDIEKFTYHVPTAEGSDLEELRTFVEEAEQWLSDKLTGPDLYGLISGLDETENLKDCAQAAVCLKAYETAVPFLDLIQTPNGFAVVSNSNQAPASRERVERLQASVARRLTAGLDKTIFLIRSKPEYLNEWKKAPAFRFRTGIVFLTATELRNYSGKQNADYCDLDVCRPMVLRYQGELAAHVSGAFLNELLRKRAENALSDFEAEVFASIQAVVGLMMQKEHRYGLIEDLLNLLESRPGDCPAYMQSPEYRLKISRKYENKKHHGTFFFGG